MYKINPENKKTTISVGVIIIAIVVGYLLYSYNKSSQVNSPKVLSAEEKMQLLQQLSKQSPQVTASSTAAKMQILQKLNTSTTKSKTGVTANATTTKADYDKKMQLLESLRTKPAN